MTEAASNNEELTGINREFITSILSGPIAMHPFLRALQLVEPSSMARALGVSMQMISKMKKAAEADPSYQVPATHLRPIQEATSGQVTIEQLVIEKSAISDRQQAAA